MVWRHLPKSALRLFLPLEVNQDPEQGTVGVLLKIQSIFDLLFFWDAKTHTVDSFRKGVGLSVYLLVFIIVLH